MVALLRLTSLWPLTLAVVTFGILVGFMETTLSVHAATYTSNAFYIGLLFLIVAVTYAVFSVFWGCLGDKGFSRYTVILGLLGTSVALFLVGPSPILPIQGSMWLLCVSLALLGSVTGGVNTGCIGDMFRTTVRHGMPNDLATKGLVSGLFNTSLAIGLMVGPFVGGGFLNKHFGFAATSSMVALLNLLVAVIVVIATVMEHRLFNRPSPRRYELEMRPSEDTRPAQPLSSEATPLIQRLD